MVCSRVSSGLCISCTQVEGSIIRHDFCIIVLFTFFYVQIRKKKMTEMLVVDCLMARGRVAEARGGCMVVKNPRDVVKLTSHNFFSH